MNIVDKLTGTHETGEGNLAEHTRRDVTFSRLRARGFAPENIDLSDCDFSVSDDDLRAQVAKERGITSEIAIAEIDLDEVILPSGAIRRRARRAYSRRVERARRKGQARFRAQQRARRFAEPKPGNHDKIVLRRQQQAVLAKMRADNLTFEEAYAAVVGA